MSIVGIGLDLVNISRVRALTEKWQARFLDRLYTETERRYCFSRPSPYASLAARFAAKEALLKAMGTGWTDGVSWQDIQILNDAQGRPRTEVSGRVQALLNRAGVTSIHTSLSHDTDYAVAEVVLATES